MDGAGVELFETRLGRCGMAWTQRGIRAIVLPELGDSETYFRLTGKKQPSRAVRQKPSFAFSAQKRIRAHLDGKLDSLAGIPLDLYSISPFAKDVYRALRKIKPGCVVTYSRLAVLAGHCGAARAVGRAMSSNPVPLIIPCHRVLTAKGKLGGFSAHGGLVTKARLLYLEGVVTNPDHARGMDLVKRAEPALGAIMPLVGPYSPSLGSSKGAYDALVDSIIYQQLSMKAASTIASRLRALGKHGHYPDPQALGDETMRSCGLSRQKIGYLRDLAARISEGSIDLNRLRRMGDERVIQTLCEVKGIGVWSAQMFLIFHLGRLDVWPVGDLGLRRAVGHVTGLESSDSSDLMKYGDRFRPYRSIAVWYLWRYEDIAKAPDPHLLA